MQRYRGDGWTVTLGLDRAALGGQVVGILCQRARLENAHFEEKLASPCCASRRKGRPAISTLISSPVVADAPLRGPRPACHSSFRLMTATSSLPGMVPRPPELSPSAKTTVSAGRN